MKHPVTLIPGDGIGPEIMGSAKQVVEAAGVEIEWHEHEAGGHAVEQYGTQVPEHVLNCIRADRVCLKGPVTTPIGTGFTSANVILIGLSPPVLVCAANASSTAVEQSGTSSMSLSLIAFHPAIDEPSNGTPASRNSSSMVRM